MHDVDVESVFGTKAIRRSGLGPRLEPRNPGVLALPGRRTRSAGGRWIPLFALLLGKHADPVKHARIGVQSLHAGFAPLRSESCQSVHVPGEDSHQTELQQGCVIRPDDHNGPVPIHWSPPCSQPHA